MLLSRSKHNDYDKATFSFEHGTRDDPEGVVGNDWDLEFGNGGDFFHVTMVTDDCSRLADLGERTWDQVRPEGLPELPAYPEPRRDPRLPAIAGHMYMVHTKDSETDLYALFRVESLDPGDRCKITWRTISLHGSQAGQNATEAAEQDPDELPAVALEFIKEADEAVRARIEGDEVLKQLAARHHLAILHAAFPNRQSYLRSAYSFTHASAVPGIHKNNVDLQFVYQPRDTVQINLRPGQQSVLLELQPGDFEREPDPSAIRFDDPAVSLSHLRVAEENDYLFRARDEQNDFFVWFRVIAVDPEGQYLAFVWRRLPGGTIVKDTKRRPVDRPFGTPRQAGPTRKLGYTATN